MLKRDWQKQRRTCASMVHPKIRDVLQMAYTSACQTTQRAICRLNLLSENASLTNLPSVAGCGNGAYYVVNLRVRKGAKFGHPKGDNI